MTKTEARKEMKFVAIKIRKYEKALAEQVARGEREHPTMVAWFNEDRAKYDILSKVA